MQYLKHLIQLEQEHGRIFLFIPVFLAFGAISWFIYNPDIPPWEIGLSTLIMVLILIKTRYSHPHIFLIISAFVYFLIGMMLAFIETTRNPTTLLSQSITTNLRGIVKWSEPLQDGKWRYLVQISETDYYQSELLSQQVMLSVTDKHDHFPSGTKIDGIAKLPPPSGPALPGLFDFSFFSYYKGISAVGYFYSIPQIVFFSETQNNFNQFLSSIQSFLNEVRTNIGTYIRRKISGDIGALAAALITDERRAISSQTIEDLRRSGLSHIIAISGINMTIAAGLLFFGMRSILACFPIIAENFSIKKISSFGALLTVTAYFLISGASISAQRAYIMTVITLISYLCEVHSIGLRSIALTAIFIICIAPSEVINPSFQMSFATTAALIASNSSWGKKRNNPHPLLKILPNKGKIVTTIIQFFKVIFLTSLIGSCSASIFLIKHFHCIPIYGIIANILAIPILSFIVMPAGLVTALSMTFSTAEIPLSVMAWGLNIIIQIANTISTISDELCVGRIPQPVFTTMVIGFILLVFLKTNMRHIGTIMIGIAIAILFILPYFPSPDLLISEDGKIVALVDNNTLISSSYNHNYFIFSQWKSALSTTFHETPQKHPEYLPINNQLSLKETLQSMNPRKFLCINKSFCAGLHHKSGTIIGVLKRKDKIHLACQLSDILVTKIKNMNSQLCNVPLIITPEMLHKYGSLEITIIPSSNDLDKPKFIIKKSIESLLHPWTKNRIQKPFTH
ncbi:ComEC/Rec2 family competence protein [Candidatus Liberibacter africanus]|nr:ComEC/Rec2 family competence protein [Candidatus Liberibacter africanus]